MCLDLTTTAVAEFEGQQRAAAAADTTIRSASTSWRAVGLPSLNRRIAGQVLPRPATRERIGRLSRRLQAGPARGLGCCHNVAQREFIESPEPGGSTMSPIAALFVGIAALTIVSTVAEAADGCGRGWYYNGRRCVPQDEPGYGYRRDYGPPQYRGDYGPPVDRGPGLRLDLGGRRDEARYSPPNPAFRTWNNCPPNFTVQDGLCKPYRGR